MPRLEEATAGFSGAPALCSRDLLQGYWQMPLGAESQELFTIILPSGLYTPTRVPQKMINATAYFQSTMAGVLEGLINHVCMVWVDDLNIWGSSNTDDLVNNIARVLGRLADVGLFAAAHKCRFWEPEVTWCSKIYSGQGVAHDPERVKGLVGMRRP